MKKNQTNPCSAKQHLKKILLLSNEKIYCLSFGILKSASIPCIISLNIFHYNIINNNNVKNYFQQRVMSVVDQSS